MAASLQVVKGLRLPGCLLSSQTLSYRPLFVNMRNITFRSDYERDPNDPKYAHWKQKPHPETPSKYHADWLSPVPVKGKIYEKLPFRILLEAGKTYTFCTCGYSKQQPFCDASHKEPHFMSTRPQHRRYRPLTFKVDETKEYWLCMCKQSNNRPFCDGTHKTLEVK